MLSWYDKSARTLPWRIGPKAKARPDPYRVWLSEVMLQQTTVPAVTPYFRAFTERWPSVADLAAAPREELMQAWAGLGYYSRARNLHAAAQNLAAQGFPETEEGWRALPGVGAYTAAAVAAIAFNQPANVVDGNVERVMARLFAVTAPLPGAKAALKEKAAALLGPDRPGDWAQALMDLGATVCTPRAPKCGQCPLARFCVAHAEGAPETYPHKTAKATRPERHGVAFFLESKSGVLLVQREETGLLAGMMALPSTPFRGEAWSQDEALNYAPAKTNWRSLGAVRHVFTHFGLRLEVWRGSATRAKAGRWVPAATVAAAGLPTVFRKAAALGLAGQP